MQYTEFKLYDITNFKKAQSSEGLAKMDGGAYYMTFNI